MSFREVVQRIKPAVVGIGVLTDQRDPLSVVIFGTGFVVHPDGWIMTNRHVAEILVVEQNGVKGVRNALARAVLFVDATGREIASTGKKAVGGFGVAPFPIIEIRMPPEAPEKNDLHYEIVPDLAVCRISIERLDRAGLKQLPFLPLCDSSCVREGDEIGTCGFPLGLTIANDGRMRQLTPIVQKGVIAAVLPWSGVLNPHAFQLDMNINGGSSGSPLFLADNGDVVGVVFAAPLETGFVTIPLKGGEERIATVALPTGFGYAVPSKRYLSQPDPVIKLPDVIRRE